MATTLDYALMAGSAYQRNRHEQNWIPAPTGWDELGNGIGYEYDPSSGYEAVAYRNGSEIVIAFAGTDEPKDWAANLALAGAFWTPEQLYKAAEFYARIRQAHPEAAISFTGHSLGGGLAALMGVFFDRPAVTFDPAPFRASANNDARQALRDHLAGTINPATGASLLSDELSAALDTFHSDQPANGTGASAEPGIRGEEAITRVVVQNEVLWKNFSGSTLGANPPQILEHGAPGFDPTELHSIGLLIALQDEAFRAATIDLPNLVALIFDQSLFNTRPAGAERTMIDHLVRHQFGVPGEFAGTGMLSHFAADMQKIAAAGPQARGDESLNKALIAFGIQAYHNQDQGFTRELFESVDGGLRFDIAAVAPDLGSNKGYLSFLQSYLWATRLGGVEARLAYGGKLAGTAEWFIAGGSMSATAKDRSAFMLGGDSGNTLAGGMGDDLLVGGASLDNLSGGGGEDALLGGAGEDTLVGQGGSDGDTARTGRDWAVERRTWRDGMVAGSYLICHIAAAYRCRYPDGMRLRTGEQAGNDAWRLAA